MFLPSNEVPYSRPVLGLQCFVPHKGMQEPGTGKRLQLQLLLHLEVMKTSEFFRLYVVSLLQVIQSVWSFTAVNPLFL